MQNFKDLYQLEITIGFNYIKIKMKIEKFTSATSSKVSSASKYKLPEPSPNILTLGGAKVLGIDADFTEKVIKYCRKLEYRIKCFLFEPWLRKKTKAYSQFNSIKEQLS